MTRMLGGGTGIKAICIQISSLSAHRGSLHLYAGDTIYGVSTDCKPLPLASLRRLQYSCKFMGSILRKFSASVRAARRQENIGMTNPAFVEIETSRNRFPDRSFVLVRHAHDLLCQQSRSAVAGRRTNPPAIRIGCLRRVHLRRLRARYRWNHCCNCCGHDNLIRQHARHGRRY